MKHLVPFKKFDDLNEGAIPVYPPGNPFKPEGSIQWTGVVPHTQKWKEQGQSFVLVVDVDYDMYTADPQFRSKANGTWSNKELPLFSSKYPRYKEVDFDLVAVEENTEKPREHWLRIADKNGVEFRVHPFHILDIQKGASVKDGIFAGDVYLIKDMRGKVINLKNDVVELKLQDGSRKNIPLSEWKKSSYTKIDENKSLNEAGFWKKDLTFNIEEGNLVISIEDLAKYIGSPSVEDQHFQEYIETLKIFAKSHKEMHAEMKIDDTKCIIPLQLVVELFFVGLEKYVE